MHLQLWSVYVEEKSQSRLLCLFCIIAVTDRFCGEGIQDDANVFRVTATDVWGNGSNLFKLLDKCDVSTVELLLVARLGLEGVDCLRHAIHTVPEGFLTIREKFISDMVNKICKVPLSQEECQELIKFFAGHKLHSYTSRKTEYTSYKK